MVAEQIRRELTGQTYLIARMIKEASTIEHRLVDLHTYLHGGFGVDFFPRHVLEYLRPDVHKCLCETCTPTVKEDIKKEILPEVTQRVTEDIIEEVRKASGARIYQEATQKLEQSLRAELSSTIREDLREEVKAKVRQEIVQQVIDTTTADIKKQAREELAKEIEERVVATMTAHIEQQCLERERNSLRQQARQEIMEEQAAEAARETQEEAHQAARMREWEAVFKSQARRVFQFSEVKNTFRTIAYPANSVPNSLKKIPSQINAESITNLLHVLKIEEEYYQQPRYDIDRITAQLNQFKVEGQESKAAAKRSYQTADEYEQEHKEELNLLEMDAKASLQTTVATRRSVNSKILSIVPVLEAQQLRQFVEWHEVFILKCQQYPEIVKEGEEWDVNMIQEKSLSSKWETWADEVAKSEELRRKRLYGNPRIMAENTRRQALWKEVVDGDPPCVQVPRALIELPEDHWKSLLKPYDDQIPFPDITTENQDERTKIMGYRHQLLLLRQQELANLARLNVLAQSRKFKNAFTAWVEYETNLNYPNTITKEKAEQWAEGISIKERRWPTDLETWLVCNSASGADIATERAASDLAERKVRIVEVNKKNKKIDLQVVIFRAKLGDVGKTMNQAHLLSAWNNMPTGAAAFQKTYDEQAPGWGDPAFDKILKDSFSNQPVDRTILEDAWKKIVPAGTLEELDTIITTEHHVFSEELNEEDQNFLRQHNLNNHTTSRALTTLEVDLAQMGWWCTPDNTDKAFLSRYAENHPMWGFESPEELAWREEQEERMRVERETKAAKEAQDEEEIRRWTEETFASCRTQFNWGSNSLFELGNIGKADRGAKDREENGVWMELDEIKELAKKEGIDIGEL